MQRFIIRKIVDTFNRTWEGVSRICRCPVIDFHIAVPVCLIQITDVVFDHCSEIAFKEEAEVEVPISECII